MNVRSELRILMRDRQFLGIVGFLALILAVAFWSGHNEQSDLRRRAQVAQSVSAEQVSTLQQNLRLADQGLGDEIRPVPTSPSVLAATTNPYVLKQNTRLALTAVGEADVRPSLVRLGDPFDPTWTYDEIVSPLALASGRFDLAFGVVVLLPLLVIALMFRLYSGDHEAGTRLLLESGQHRLWKILAIRASLKYLLFTGSLGGMFFLGVGLTTGGIPLEECLRWITFCGTYILIWFLICFWVCLFRAASGSNIAVLISIWALLVIVIPIGLNAWVSNPEESLAKLEVALEYRGVLEHLEATPEMIASLEASAGIPPGSAETSTAAALAMRQFAIKQVRPQMQGLQAQAIAREKQLQRLGGWNPAVSLNALLAKLAGRDPESFRRFERYLSQEHARRQAFFLKPRLIGARMSERDLAEIPRLGPQEEPSGPAWREAWPLGLTSLILLGIVGLGVRRQL